MRRALPPLLLATLPLTACGDDAAPTPDAHPAADAAPTDASWTDWTLPDPGAGGFKFETDTFPVAAGQEIQRCYFVAVPDVNNGQPLNIGRIETAINPGSHHMNVFRVKTIVNLDGAPGTMVENGECFKSANWADWPLVANSQNSSAGDPYTDWTLPTDVAHKFMPGEKLMIQVHYVNATDQPTPFQARAGIAFFKSPSANPQELGTLFATQQSIRVCQSNPNPSYSGACSFGNTPVTIIASNGHFHSRGKEFQIFTWDGLTTTQPPPADRFYDSQAWDEPPMLRDLSVPVPAGSGVWWTCDFQWSAPLPPTTCADVNAADKQMQNDCCYTFGPKVETSEHCNAFVYYYPKVNDVLCN
jgi:hypothetical protein